MSRPPIPDATAMAHVSSATTGRVALIGGAGLVGRAVTAALVAQGREVVILDRASPSTPVAADARVRTVRCDLLDVDAAHLAGTFRQFQVQAVVHLAAMVNPPRDVVERATMRRLHEQGTATVCAAVVAAELRRLVLVSSATVYGAHPDNPIPLEVEAPLRPGDLPYAIDKAAQEAIARRAFAGDGTSGRERLSVVRPAIVYGPGAHNYLTEILRRARVGAGPWRGGILPALDGCRPPLQFVHVDDVAAVVVAALFAPKAGTFHAASGDWVGFDDVAAQAGLRVVSLPSRPIGVLLDAVLPHLPPAWRAPSTLLPYLQHPFVLSMARTTAALGVAPRHSAVDALRSILGATKR